MCIRSFLEYWKKIMCIYFAELGEMNKDVAVVIGMPTVSSACGYC